jgi:prefoldin subunit 5
MTQARAGLDNAKVMDVFTRQSQYLDALQQRETAAVVARDEAQRDAQLALFLLGNEGMDGATLFAQDIETRLSFFYGALPAGATSADPDPKHPLWRRMDIMGIDASLNAQLQDGYLRAVRDYQTDKGKRPTDCGTVLLKPAAGSDGQAAQDDYGELAKRCSQIALERTLAQAQALKTAPSTSAGASTAGTSATGQAAATTGLYTPYAVAFNYQEAMQAVAAIQDKIAAERSAADALNKSLAASEKALEASFTVKKSDSGQLTSISGEIHSALSQGETYLNNPYAKKVVSAKIGECVEAIVDATATSMAASGTASTGTAAGSTTKTSTPVTGTAAASGSCGSGASEASQQAALALFQAAAGVGDVFSNPPRIPHPNVLAVARAQMSYSQDVANEEIADLNAQANAASAQLEAITTALYMLSRAKTELRAANVKLAAGEGLTDFLANPKTSHEAYRHAAAALFYYTSAWNRGEILADEIVVESDIAERRAVVQQSGRAAQAWVETIGPGLDTLVQYGTGGIDPKTLAQLIGSFGLVGTAVGVNR